MGQGHEVERRRFIRIETGLRVRYKFLSLERGKPVEAKTYEGYTQNLSQGGFLLMGALPEGAWKDRLLKHQLLLGVNLELSPVERPVRAVCHAAWVEPARAAKGATGFGLAFREITAEDRERVLRYILGRQV